jgi:ubiquinone/menaquinone biosynthesis C-methylase UbiE
MTMSQVAEYGLGVSELERQRLLAQCQIHRAEAEDLVDRIGVSAGWRVVDIGCGPLGILDVLAARVGPTGTVTGLDREERFLRMAERSLRERHVGELDLVLGEATATGLPSASFDLVHERLVLNNVVRPADVVREMVRLARPGGYVALQDKDWISWTCEPAHPDWDALYNATARAWVGDVFVGRRLFGLLQHAGLVDVQVTAQTRAWRRGDAYQKLLLRFVDIYRKRIESARLLTAEEIDGSVRRLRAHLDDADTFTLYATLFQAWGRKP